VGIVGIIVGACPELFVRHALVRVRLVCDVMIAATDDDRQITGSTLVLGAAGKTGSRVAADLINRGLPVRTAARSGADVVFDWSDRGSYAPALKDIERVYLMLRLCVSTLLRTSRRSSTKPKPPGWRT
jgi:hypothetical protein